MERINLNGGWELQYGRQIEQASRMEQPEIPDAWTRVAAQVPGNVELDLVRAGLLPEQLEKGHNIYLLRELETMQWWYTKTFTWEAESGSSRHELVLEGVDTLASYWLNGVRIGQTENMLIPHRFDVTDKLQSGENQLVIGIDSTVLAAHEEPVEAGAWAMENNWESLSIRKAAHSFGWDIMPTYSGILFPGPTISRTNDSSFALGWADPRKDGAPPLRLISAESRPPGRPAWSLYCAQLN